MAYAIYQTIYISSGDTYAADGAVNSTNRVVSTGDRIRGDVDAVHTTPAKGCELGLVFEAPA